MQKDNYKLALEELLLCEQGLSICTPSIIENVDNVALMLLDLVWCSYKIQDINQLGISVQRLERVRSILDKQYSERRLLQVYGSTMMVAPVYLRLEMLEGMAAYYAGESKVAVEKLQKAKSRWDSLQVMQEDVEELLVMGFEQDEVVKGLRLAGRNKTRALELIMRHREENKALEEREKERNRQAKYGKTSSGAYVIVKYVDRLVSLGFNEEMAAESLRVNDNDFEKALDLLQNPTLLSRYPKLKKIFDEQLAELAQSVQFESTTDQYLNQELNEHSNNDVNENAMINGRQNEQSMQNGDGDTQMEDVERDMNEDDADRDQTQNHPNTIQQNNISSSSNQQQYTTDWETNIEMEDLFENIRKQDPLNIYFDGLEEEIDTIVNFLSALENRNQVRN
eukprot:TRINITY_DN37458_c0_g2_i1.p1 TRINITY_DN37458_c0_g2~~TRINITY_DN37458_c0_g2_i1.p1  ORF type:complete len:415 (-),score=62.85 TRINITY_DN37458_c0_g2_i1:766-1950(-)